MIKDTFIINLVCAWSYPLIIYHRHGKSPFLRQHISDQAICMPPKLESLEAKSRIHQWFWAKYKNSLTWNKAFHHVRSHRALPWGPSDDSADCSRFAFHVGRICENKLPEMLGHFGMIPQKHLPWFQMIPVREIRYNSFAQMIVKNHKRSKVAPLTRKVINQLVPGGWHY